MFVPPPPLSDPEFRDVPPPILSRSYAVELCLATREREIERDRDRERNRDRERDREGQRDRDRQRPSSCRPTL